MDRGNVCKDNCRWCWCGGWYYRRLDDFEAGIEERLEIEKRDNEKNKQSKKIDELDNVNVCSDQGIGIEMHVKQLKNDASEGYV